MSEATRILFCHCSQAQVVPAEVKNAIVAKLREANVDFQSVPDLCHLTATRDPLLQEVIKSGAVNVVACFPRAVKWLVASAKAPLPDGAKLFNMRSQSAQEITEALLAEIGPTDRAVASNDSENGSETGDLVSYEKGSSIAWFPVIDFDRCTHCMQCLNFCLFGVFAVDTERHIEVLNPTNCKPNCPACSRVCPEVAIIFPKYKCGPINGDLVADINSAREQVKVDVSALLGGDAYSALRERSERAKSRFSPERDPEKALQERQKCLAAIAQLAPRPEDPTAD